jgi:hypothetical protein
MKQTYAHMNKIKIKKTAFAKSSDSLLGLQVSRKL